MGEMSLRELDVPLQLQSSASLSSQPSPPVTLVGFLYRPARSHVTISIVRTQLVSPLHLVCLMTVCAGRLTEPYVPMNSIVFSSENMGETSRAFGCGIQQGLSSRELYCQVCGY